MLPSDPKARKRIPLATGLLDYFPDALAAVAELSLVGNEQHNPGQPLHWARGKSDDHADCLMRHFMARGTWDTDGIRHAAKVAWRALALLQLEIEAAHARTLVAPLGGGGAVPARLPAEEEIRELYSREAYDKHPGATEGGAIQGRPCPVPMNPVSQSTGD